MQRCVHTRCFHDVYLSMFGVFSCVEHTRTHTHTHTHTQEEREAEEKRLQEIMEENNKKILEAQRKLVSN